MYEDEGKWMQMKVNDYGWLNIKKLNNLTCPT